MSVFTKRLRGIAGRNPTSGALCWLMFRFVQCGFLLGLRLPKLNGLVCPV